MRGLVLLGSGVFAAAGAPSSGEWLLDLSVLGLLSVYIFWHEPRAKERDHARRLEEFERIADLMKGRRDD